MNNEQDVRPPIPSDLKRCIREEAGYGCVCCGNSIIHYHHIIHWNVVKQHTLDNLVAVCPDCHTQIHNKQISTEQLKALKKNPYNKNKLTIKNKFYISNIDTLDIKIGGMQFRKVNDILTVHGQKVIFFNYENGQVLLNALFYNKEGNLEAMIIDNEWIVFIKKNLWDIEFSRGELTLRNAKGKIFLKLNIDMELNTISILGKIYYGNIKLNIKKESVDIIDSYLNAKYSFEGCSFTGDNKGLVFD